MSDSIWQTLNAHQLAQLLGLRNIVKKQGGGVMTSCPVHGGQTGSSPPLSLDSKPGQGVVAFCHRCGYKAGTLQLVTDAEGLLDHAAAAKWLEDQTKTSSQQVDEPDVTYLRPPPPAKPVLPAVLQRDSSITPEVEQQMLETYADEIGFTASQLREAGLQAAKRHDRLALRLEARDATGQVTSWQDIMRAGDDGKRAKLSAAGLPAPIWGLDQVAASTTYVRIVICEGISDYLTARIALATLEGWCAVGAAGAQLVKQAATQAEALRPSAIIYIVPDHDDAGIKACIAACAPLEGLTIALLPAEDTDLNDLHLTNYELDEFSATQDTRESIIDAAESATSSAITLLPADRSTHLTWQHEAQAVELAGDIDDAKKAFAAPVEKLEGLPDTLEVRLGLAGAQAIHPETGAAFDLWRPDFDTHQILRTIRAHATTLLLSPVALLGVLLAEHAASIAHNWVLPPRAGNNTAGAGSPLSLYIALVANPGVGKTEAQKQGQALAVHADHDTTTSTAVLDYKGDDKWTALQVEGSPVSGEAILEKLTANIEYQNLDDEDGATTTKRVAARHRARYHYGELEQLLVTGARTGSTLAPILRSAWSGEMLATTTASTERDRRIPAGTYTLGVTACAQLSTAGQLLRATARGDAQRWIWLPAHAAFSQAEQDDASMIAAANDGRIPGVTLDHWKLPDHVQHVSDHVEIIVDSKITEEIIAGTRTTLHGHALPGTEAATKQLDEQRTRTGENENQHATQTRLRIAAAIARICQLAPEITLELWHWSGAFMSIDHATRSILTEHGRSEAEDASEAKSAAQVAQRVRSDQAVRSDHATQISYIVERAANAIATLTERTRDRTITKSQAIRGISPSIINAAQAAGISRRELRDMALDMLEHDQRMNVIAPTQGQTANRWQLR